MGEMKRQWERSREILEAIDAEITSNVDQGRGRLFKDCETDVAMLCRARLDYVRSLKDELFTVGDGGMLLFGEGDGE